MKRFLKGDCSVDLQSVEKPQGKERYAAKEETEVPVISFYTIRMGLNCKTA
jgi:hypothetical protein